MNDLIDRLLAENAQLRERMDALERAVYHSKTVRGFTGAARVLDLSTNTVRRMFKDGRLPRPSRVNAWKKGINPEWSLSVLLAYKNRSVR